MAAAIGPNTREATEEVVSEDEDSMVPFEALDNLEALLSKGSLLKRCSLSLSLQNENNKKLKTSTSYLTVLSSKKQAKERICCIFPGSMMELKPAIDNIFKEEMATFVGFLHCPYYMFDGCSYPTLWDGRKKLKLF